MTYVLLIAAAAAVLLVATAAAVLRHGLPDGRRMFVAVRIVLARISRCAGVVFLLFLLLALSYEQSKELIGRILPAQSFDQIRISLKLLFRTEYLFSAVEAVTFYSLILSCFSGLGAIIAGGVQIVLCSHYAEYGTGVVACENFSRRSPVVAGKSFLVFSSYRS